MNHSIPPSSQMIAHQNLAWLAQAGFISNCFTNRHFLIGTKMHTGFAFGMGTKLTANLQEVQKHTASG